MSAPGRLRFRYARSSDGTSIAWARLGSGPPLVLVPPVPFSNVGGEYAVPLLHEVYQRLSRTCELILYDGRGTGASQRTVDDLSATAQTADLAAVLDAAGHQRAALLALYLACAPALTFAATDPARVSHLVLFGAVSSGAEALARPGTEALLGLIDTDWELFAQTAALDWMGWRVAESGMLVAEAFRSATTPDIARLALSAYREADVRPLLGDVEAPTLVVHRRDGRQVTMEQSSTLAAAVPQAQLHVLDGASATLFFDEPMSTADLVASFVAPGRPVVAATGPSLGDAGLSPREREVLALIAGGESNAEIARRLGLSVHTVERHAANIYRKIEARGRADATAWALRHELA